MPLGPIEITVTETTNPIVGLSGVSVALTGGATQITDSNGKTTFLVDTAGNHFTFVASKSGYQTATVITPTYVTTQPIIMTIGSFAGGNTNVAVTVTDFDTTAAISGATVTVTPVIPAVTGTTDGSGQVTVSPPTLTGGTYNIIASKTGYGSGGVVVPADSDSIIGIAIQALPSGNQTFTVYIAETTTPLQDVLLTIYDYSGYVVTARLTNSSGLMTYALDLNASYVIFLTKSGYQEFGVEIDIINGVANVTTFGMYAE